MAPFCAPKLQAEQVILQVYGVPSCRVTINRTSDCIVDVSSIEFGSSGPFCLELRHVELVDVATTSASMP